MPPPMTSIRLGIERSSSAPVESTMRGSSGTKGSLHRLRARGDDRLLEFDDLLRAGLFLAGAVGDLDFDVMRIEEHAIAAHDLDLARLGHAGEAAGELADDLVLPGEQLRRDRSAARRT